MKPGGLINAYGLVVAWQATDSTNPAAATATTTATTDTNHTTTSASKSTSDDRASGLSAGAKAGIGIGVSVGAIMVLALLAFRILRRRKRQGASSAPGPRTVPANQKHPTELDSALTRGYELGSIPLHEADSLKNGPYEPLSHSPVELEGAHSERDRL
ncbi:hypothetical protein N7520_004418 [Penicillium odoratum]|uniref:uncharacterized protein n=1 Tax=Penicillium odoratum TaxID=1167516 RepID=UPI002547FB13|nr:uncharacterized protein N7520_004418 [Penicillium odoratum]KAJ5764859.1 hypothetical protein N7520_004418 [Penicillium odoratum]